MLRRLNARHNYQMMGAINLRPRKMLCAREQNLGVLVLRISGVLEAATAAESTGADASAHGKSSQQEFDQLALAASVGLLEYFGEPAARGPIGDLQLRRSRAEVCAAGQE